MASDPLIPEDFDLDAALSAPSTTPDDKRKTCPECGSIAIVRKTSAPGRRTYIDPWYCDHCDSHFDTPRAHDP